MNGSPQVIPIASRFFSYTAHFDIWIAIETLTKYARREQSRHFYIFRNIGAKKTLIAANILTIVSGCVIIQNEFSDR